MGPLSTTECTYLPTSSWTWRYGAAYEPHGGLKLGSQKGVILATQNEPKLKVSPMVYLHAGLEIGSPVPHADHWESNEACHALGPQSSACHSPW